MARTWIILKTHPIFLLPAGPGGTKIRVGSSSKTQGRAPGRCVISASRSWGGGVVPIQQQAGEGPVVVRGTICQLTVAERHLCRLIILIICVRLWGSFWGTAYIYTCRGESSGLSNRRTSPEEVYIHTVPDGGVTDRFGVLWTRTLGVPVSLDRFGENSSTCRYIIQHVMWASRLRAPEVLAHESVPGGRSPSKGEEIIAASVLQYYCSVLNRHTVGIWPIERADESLEEGKATRGWRAGFLVAGTGHETDDGAYPNRNEI